MVRAYEFVTKRPKFVTLRIVLWCKIILLDAMPHGPLGNAQNLGHPAVDTSSPAPVAPGVPA